MAGKSNIEAGRAFLKLDIDDKAFDKKLAGISRKFKNTGRNIRAVGVGIGGFGAAITGPLALAINKASEAQEVFSKFDAVFGKQSASIREWGDELAKQVGRSKVEIAKSAAGLQDLFVPLGLSTEKATELSKSLVELSVDLGSFNDIADADVMRDLQAAMTGSSETMKKYGVVVDAAAVKQELLNQNLDPTVATNAQKVMARFNIIMAKTTAAQGDATRTAGGFANQMKALQANISDAAVDLGTVFLPAATKLIGIAIHAIGVVSEWAKRNEKLVITIGIIGATATTVGIALFGLGTAITAVTIGVGGLVTAFTFLAAHPVVAALLLIGAAVAGIVVYIQSLGDETEKTAGKIQAAGNKAKNAAPGGGADIKRQAELVQKQAAAFEANFKASGVATQAIASNTERQMLDIQKEINQGIHILVDLARNSEGGLVIGTT